MSSLTDKDIKALQPKDHHYRVALGDGLFLWISSSGKKSWQYRYHVHSNNIRKEKIYTIGDFQQINLSHARELHATLRKEVLQGIDIQAVKVEKKKSYSTSQENAMQTTSTQPTVSNRRKFLTNMTQVMGGIGGIFALIPFLSSMSPSERAKSAGAPIEIDISSLQPGAYKVVEWRGKPVWVVRRTKKMIEDTLEDDEVLRDPQSVEEHQPEYTQNKFRSINPEYLVLLGVCTHLGCSPLYKPSPKSKELGLDWTGGFFCPCHGSKFDLSGRVHKGVPAPYNLEVPPYYFASDTRIIVGEDGENV
tara:strand:+ start:5571 stop:6485 length:915 start_codon:yes stop_codon:yes gene_type:complete